MFRIASISIAYTFAMIFTFVGGFTLAANAANSEWLPFVFAGYFTFFATLIATVFIASRFLIFWANNYPTQESTNSKEKV